MILYATDYHNCHILDNQVFVLQSWHQWTPLWVVQQRRLHLVLSHDESWALLQLLVSGLFLVQFLFHSIYGSISIHLQLFSMLSSETDYRNTGRRGRWAEMTAEWTTLVQHIPHILTDLTWNELTFEVESWLFWMHKSKSSLATLVHWSGCITSLISRPHTVLTIWYCCMRSGNKGI